MQRKQPKNLMYDPWQVLERSVKCTPDFSRLNKVRGEHFVLVTGTARRSRARNDLLIGCNYYGLANTTADIYMMKRGPFQYQTNQHPEPMIFEFPSDKKERYEKHPDMFQPKDFGKVQGEMWGVPLRVLTDLDKFMGNGEGVRREQRYISLVNTDHEVRNHRVWMYMVDFEYFDEYSDIYPLYNTTRGIPNTGPMVYYYSG